MITKIDDHGDEAANPGEAVENWAARSSALEDLMAIGSIDGLPARNGSALADADEMRSARYLARWILPRRSALGGQGPRAKIAPVERGNRRPPF
jgi:hypothetical protein